MKRVVIFAVFVLMGMGIVLGGRPEPLRRQPVVPRISDVDDPFAPDDIERPKPPINSFMQEARQAQQPNADPNGEFRTYANEPVVPGEYNGDVRHLPQVQAKEMVELELREPASTRKRPATSMGAAAAPDISNNISTEAMPSPVQSFAGMSFTDDCNGLRCGAGQPPDVNGDVGMNHYIEAVNYGIAIYNKSGNRLAAFTESSLWRNASTGTPCDAQAHGDPVVVYDQFADRWIISHFAFGFDSIGYPAGPFYECLAVSKTSDPVAGGWWFYPLRVDTGASGQPPANTMGDYPKFGNWNDGCLYMSANGFILPSFQFNGTLFASMNKADMYSGQPLTSSIGFIANSGSPSSLLPGNISGAKNSASIPPAGTPNYFVSQSMDSFSWEVRKFTPGNSPKICGAGGTLSAPVKVGQTPFDSPNDVPQPNASGVQSIGERLMQKAQYRKVGLVESLWVTHSVQANSSSTVRPQWAQIDVTGGLIRPTAVQQQIYTPETTLNRWLPSIAADHDGNAAIGYSTSNSSVFPSIAYAGRLATDPLNQLSQGEVQLVAGGGSQRNTCGGAGPCDRWGDYSAMSIDPADDCTFWYVNQYYSSQANGDSGNWSTRIGAFKFPSCGATAVSRTLTISSVNPSNGAPIIVSPDDNNDATNGTTQFQRIYSNGVTVSLTAPAVLSGNNFQKWQRDGADLTTSTSTTVVMDGNHTMTAVYVTPTTRTLTVASANPGSGVSISTNPNDNSNQGGGASQFTRTYNNNTLVNLTAPATAGGNNFQKWQRDGADFATTAATSLTMDGNHTMTAVYIAPAPVQITVETSPGGRSFTVDGTSYTSTQTFTWTPGSNHTIATTSPQSGTTGTQYVWSNWSDSGAITHTVSPNAATTYTANFTTQYLLTMIPGPGGIVRPATGFYDSGQAVNISNTPAANFSFNGWRGTGAGSFTGIFKSATVTMNGPITETAAFGGKDTTVQFSANSYSANESDGSVTVTVTRVGDPNSAPLVAYVTSDGTAKEGRDYVSSQGILTFAPGEMSKTFTVLIIDNGFVDSTRTVNLNLVNVASAFLGDSIAAVLTINDNDAGKAPTNPVDTPRTFVQFNYFDFLTRNPDPSGWDFWTNEITKCGTNISCTEVARVNTSGAFFLSIEFQQTGYLIERIYKVAYGDATGNSGTGGPHQLSVPSIRFADFLRDSNLIQRNLIVLQPGWEQLLENNKKVYTDLFVRTTRFTQAYSPDMSVPEFVDRLNRNAGNVLSASERTTAINRFGTNPVDSNNFTARANTVRQIAEDPDLVAAEQNRSFVLMQYFGYLRRNPDDAPESTRDYSGYDFWLTKLNQFKGNFVTAELVKAFITSSEYRQRFGP